MFFFYQLIISLLLLISPLIIIFRILKTGHLVYVRKKCAHLNQDTNKAVI